MLGNRNCIQLQIYCKDKSIRVPVFKISYSSSLVTQWAKIPALSLLYLEFLLWPWSDPWPRNFYMLRAWPKKLSTSLYRKEVNCNIRLLYFLVKINKMRHSYCSLTVLYSFFLFSLQSLAHVCHFHDQCCAVVFLMKSMEKLL